MPGGFDSGKPTLPASAFSNIFTDLGVFYFARYVNSGARALARQRSTIAKEIW